MERKISKMLIYALPAVFLLMALFLFVLCVPLNADAVQNSVTYMVKSGDSEFAVYATQTADSGSELVFPSHPWFKVSNWYTNSELSTPAPTAIGDTPLTLYGSASFALRLGDVSGNGSVSIDDVIMYRKVLVGGYSITRVSAGAEWSVFSQASCNPTGEYFFESCADTDKNTNLDIRDVSVIRMSIAGGYGVAVRSGGIVTPSEVTAIAAEYRGANVYAGETLANNNGVYSGGTYQPSGADFYVTATTSDGVNFALESGDYTVGTVNTVSAGVKNASITHTASGATGGADITVVPKCLLKGIDNEWINGISMNYNVAQTNKNEYMLANVVIDNDNDAFKINSFDSVSNWWCGTVSNTNSPAFWSFDGDGNIKPIIGLYDIYYDLTGNLVYLLPKTITLHYYKPNGWSGVKAYAYNATGTTYLGGWPGTAMTDEGDGWYSVTVSSQATNVIFTDSANSGNRMDIDDSSLRLMGERWISGNTVYTAKP